MNKPHIKPKVVHLTIENFISVSEMVSNEILKWEAYKVGRTNISTCPICFDTETTTVNNMAFIYIYQLQVGKLCILCRIKSLIMSIFKEIHYTCDYYELNIYCGIANIKYEWSFLCKDFMKLLSDVEGSETRVGVLLDKLTPLNVNIGRIIIIDILKMSGSNLARTGKDYCTTQKLKGDLDYKIIRNSKTSLTETEYGYCINDVVVGAEYLLDRHERYTKNGKKIPFTATGVVRNIMKEEAYKSNPDKTLVYDEVLTKVKEGFPRLYTDYHKIMNYLFRGGYTHGNLYYAGELLKDVEHIDYTSDYPACMLQHKYPTKFYKDVFIYNGKKIIVEKFTNEEGLNKLITKDDIAFYADFEFTNLVATTDHSIESINKTILYSDDAVVDNGRIRKTKVLKVMLTEQDYIAYKMFYKWDNIKITNLHIGLKENLPWYVIKAVIESYVDKKRLKDAKLPYAVEKAILNSCYGCTVQGMNIGECRDIYFPEFRHIKSPVPFKYLDLTKDQNIKYFGYVKDKLIKDFGYKNNEALDKAIRRVYNDIYEGNEIPNNDKYLNIYNTIVYKLQQRSYKSEIEGSFGKSKMLSAYWGIWITAYARTRLLSMVYEVEKYANTNGLDPIVVYCDTDSMFINGHQNDKCWNDIKTIIDKYNKDTEDFNKENLRIYNKDGLLDDIGQFAWEPTCTHFKQLGAKRYLQRFFNGKEYVIESTIAGLNKDAFSRKINEIEGTIEDKFNFFSDGMIFNDFETSKLMPVYNTNSYSFEVTDEEGNTEIMHEECGQVLKPVEFKMMLCGLLALKVKERIG